MSTDQRFELLREATALGVLPKYVSTAPMTQKVTPEHVEAEWGRLDRLVRVAKGRAAR